MDVVLVESPAKAKTINKYLGRDYKVIASYGHVRDLPSKDGSVDPDNDFAMSWQEDAKSKKRLSDLAAEVKAADRLILATDPDREGEAISWHVLDVLKRKRALKDKPVQRVVFNEITKAAILKAMAQPRDLDQQLVDAYLARRALDYLVGFTLSPVLWRKLPGARSAGRVQSVALRLICERENEIDRFTAQEYWSVEADLATSSGDTLTARLVALDGKKLDRLDLKDEAAAEAAVAAIKAANLQVSSLEKKPGKRNPQPPFTTSTLQQEASRKLGFGAQRTMRVAQDLYEGKTIKGEVRGLITYMRTDGVSIAQEALEAARHLIAESYGARYRPDTPRLYKSKAKNAQEAHEAIRPVDVALRPSAVKAALNDDEFRLYDLIWKRTVASQMASAEVERTTIDIAPADDAGVGLRATGTVVQFDGFLKLYQEGRDDAGDDDDGARLPQVKQGEALSQRAIRPTQHFTEPPPRYSEASLVKKLEELGIGRPSTYASILSVLQDRTYVRLEKKRFIPDDKGRLVTAFLESFFDRYVEYGFTAELEEKLDLISAGDAEWKAVLRAFWEEFKPKTEEVIERRNAEILDALNDYLGPLIFKSDKEGDPRACPACADGRLSLKTGRYGAFIGCSNYPDCRFTRQFSDQGAEDAAAKIGDEPTVLGKDSETGEEVTVRTGRFGPYIQRGEPADKAEKPKRASIPKDWPIETIDLARALMLLSLPRTVGQHPEDSADIEASIGRYGPYLKHNNQYARLSGTDEVFEVGLNRAVVLLAEAKANPRRGRAAPKKALKELGEHPEEGGEIKILDGRYGAYVNHGKINATLPKDMKPEDVTLEQALTLLAEKASKAPASKKKPAARARKAPAKKKSPAKTKKAS